MPYCPSLPLEVALRRRTLGAYSSIGQSPRLITGLFLVRPQVGPLNAFEISVSIQASIQTLQTLQVLDSKISKLEGELGNEKSGMDEKTERHVALVAQVARLEKTIDGMEGTKHELNTELRQHMLLVDKAREKMARCRNEREANAATRELEEIRRMYRDRELEIQKLAGLIEDGRADLAKVDEERESIGSQIDETGGEAAEKVKSLSLALQEESAKREQAMSLLGDAMRRRYIAVRNRRGSGSAAVVDGSCTACHISLSPMLYQEIMRQTELHECPSCHRILYYSETAPSATAGNEAADDGAASPG